MWGLSAGAAGGRDEDGPAFDPVSGTGSGAPPVSGISSVVTIVASDVVSHVIAPRQVLPKWPFRP